MKTEKGTWTAKVFDIREKPSADFVVSMNFEGEGEPKYGADLHLNRDRLKADRQVLEREIDLILADVTAWLATDPPRGTRQLL